MLEFFVNYFHQHAFVLEFFFCALVFLLPLKKRKGFCIRAAFSFLVQLVINYFFVDIVIEMLQIHMLFAFFVDFVTTIGVFMFCAELSLPDAVFGASCAFAVQHMAYVIYSVFDTLYGFGPMIGDILSKVILGLVAFPCYCLFARKLPINGHYGVRMSEAIRSVIIVLPFAFFLSMLAEMFYQSSDGNATALFIVCRVYAFICCSFVLWVQTSINQNVMTKVELRTQQLLFKQQKEQYELRKDHIDLINRKCHDLKHQISALRGISSEKQRDRYLDEIEDSVMIYDSMMKTGNEVLDTILTERSLYCEREGITWTCMAEGDCLSFVDPIDLYTLLGNALDNAMESVCRIQDPDHRVISLNIHQKGQLVIIQMENYYQHEIAMVDGMPRTSKGDTDYHGIGLHSIESTAEKYGGSISITTENQIFKLCIVLPIPG